MDKKQKCQSNNQWAGANISLTSQTNVKEKDENNNQWTSTLKKSREMYATNCHLESIIIKIKYFIKKSLKIFINTASLL